MVQFDIPDCFRGDCDCTGASATGAAASSFCPYGDCYNCIPSECIGEKCCCCASIDIVLGIRSRCFDRIFLSCNIDGTSPGPGEDPFSAECPQCLEACGLAIGGAASCSSISDPVSPPDWWNFPPSIGPCTCECAEFVNPSDPSAGCNLTCVKCAGLKCVSAVEVLGSNCNYQFNVTPSTGCCGTPAFVDAIFAIDYSASMGPHINNVINNVEQLADDLSVTGGLARFGLIIYGKGDNDVREIHFSNGEILTTDVEDFKASLQNGFPLSGGKEPDFDAAEHALVTYIWNGVENLLFLIGDEPVESGYPITGPLGDPTGQPSAETLINLANDLGVTVHVVQPITSGENYDTKKTDLALGTGGQDIEITTNFSDVIDDLGLNIFAASCDCLDLTPIPIEICTGGTGASGDECIDPDVNIPVRKCVEDDNSDCMCNEPMSFSVCGEIVVVTPDPNTINLLCCGEIEGGACACPTTLNPPAGCCGLSCADVDVCEEFSDLQSAIDITWCECWQKGMDGEFIIETPGCSRCVVPEADDPDFGNLDIDAIMNCVIKVPDGEGGYISKSRSEIVAEVEAAWASCLVPPEIPPPSISEADCLPNCDRPDENISGITNCTSTRNPDVVLLNNGIGLVAYESMDDVSVIKINQFNTSSPAKILPNRRTNYGRLENNIRWADGAVEGLKLAKIYYFDDISSHFLNGVSGFSEEGTLSDSIVFQSGPLQNQCFSLNLVATGEAEELPIGEDDIGKYIIFSVPSDVQLSNPFPSADDVYDIEWFLIDSDDIGLTGSAANVGDVPGAGFLTDPASVNQILQLTPHTHDGVKVSISNPSLAVAHNYMNAIENSHYVYLTYQALENGKWNVYLRQIRLSEYSRQEQVDSLDKDNTNLLSELSIEELNYRVVCVNDECSLFGSKFLAKRTVALEVVLKDGRDVYNREFLSSTESWSICSGSPTGQFVKEKVFVELSHSIVVDRCPNQFEFNEICYNWEVGDEFSVPYKELSASDLFTLLRKANDNAIGLGESVVEVSGITITSSQAGAVWFDSVLSDWAAPSSEVFQELSKFKGLDLSEPIPITEFEEGHCTHPVVKVNTNNDVYVVYECTDPLVHQVHITGTAIPSSSLPFGIFSPKNLDATLDYFLSPADFTYKASITSSLTEGINQLPDVHIDPNDVIHLAWQSNRDDYWEIYYANSSESFSPKRITDSKSRSLKPRITGDERGNTHIVWHDNRFGNWEILMAYRDDERVHTLFEQDPYLAGIRNPGYTHVTDVIPVVLKNESISDPLCISDLSVRFFEDRLLTQSAFAISVLDFPVAFQIPGVQDDRSTVVWTYTEINWTAKATQVQIEGTMYDHYGPSETSMDATLVGSSYDTAKFVFAVQPSHVRFLASPYEDENSELQALKDQAILLGEDPDLITLLDTDWYKNIADHTNWVKASSVTDFVSGTVYSVDDLIASFFATQGFTSAIGRYKRVEVLMATGANFDFDSIEIVSVKKNRLCLAPQETVTAYLDLTPSIRLDKSGNEVVDSPLPIDARKNIVYFMQTIGITDLGQIYAFPDPMQSISCETCVEDDTPWDAASCTLSFKFDNFDNPPVTRFYNAQIRFYTDQERTNLVAQFDAFKDANGNLECFTLDDNTKAQDVWQDEGFEVFSGKSRTVTLWPMLSNTSGLLCGVKYWVETAICFGDKLIPCDREMIINDATRTSNPWTCECNSVRWTERFGQAPINIRDIVRWRSSGDGFSDTRLTETGNVNNYNPTINIREDLTGIVIYESNRDHISELNQEGEKYTLYATAFSVFPSSSTYSSGTEVITGRLGSLLIQSDIPINACTTVLAGTEIGCDDCDDSKASCEAIEGRNASFTLDQYGNIFLSAEQQNNQTKCEEFREDKQQSLIVHRCGARAKNLVFTAEESGGAGTFSCTADGILGKIAPLTQDKTFKQIIKMARVKDKFAKYHITRVKKPAAVVDQCSIEIEVITEPDTIAVRLKNENESWSTWYPFDGKQGEYSMSIPWDLSLGSGVKAVSIEAATYQGMSASFTMTVIADYKGVDHTINFYKLPQETAPVPGKEVTNEELISKVANNPGAFSSDNMLPQLSGLPVAGIRNPTLESPPPAPPVIVSGTGEFIFVEIIPSSSYLDTLRDVNGVIADDLTPTFDVLQQGEEDSFALPSTHDSSSGSFRGAFAVKKDDMTFFKDGLSFVIAHFKKDCSDITIAAATADLEYARDIYNIVVPKGITTPDGNVPTDVWAEERDEFGKIKHPITIRGTEDPYFVFGDPNYRIKKQDE